MATGLELIGIEFKLYDEEKVFDAVRKIDEMMKSVEGRHTIELELGASAKRIDELTGKINGLNESISKSKKGSSESKAYRKELAETRRELNNVRLGHKLLSNAVKAAAKAEREAAKEAKQAQKEAARQAKETAKAEREAAKEAEKRAMSYGKYFNKISTSLTHAGQRLQTLGNTLTTIGQPFRNVLQGTFLTAGNKIYSAVSEGFETGFNRYDTIKSYERIMAEYNKTNYDVAKSRDALVASVKGLPTGLDEIMSLTQRYTLSLGDMEKGTQLAIATNNAFLASMSTESQRYQGMLQMQDLVNGKELTSKEWMSLGSSMGKAINEVGKQFGYTDKNMGEFKQELYAGNIATNKFIDALIKVGTEGGTLEKLAANAKLTWNAVFSNIRNAFARMGEGILNTLDEIAQRRTGKTLPELLGGYMDGVDDVTARIQKWIKLHENDIMDFIDTLKGIDWLGIGRNFAKGAEHIAKGFKWLIDTFGDKPLKAYAYIVPLASAIGKGITILGGITKGTSWIWAALGAGVMTKFGNRGGAIGTLVKGIFGKKGATDVAKEAASAPKALDTLRNVFNKLQGVLIAAGEVAIISGTAWFSAKTIKSAVSDFKDIVNILGEIDYDGAKNALAGISAMFVGGGVVGTMIGKVGKKAGLEALAGTAIGALITMILSLASAVDMAYLKQAVTDFRDTVVMFDEIRSALDEFDVGALRALASKAAEVTTAMNDIRTELTGEANKEGGKEGIKALPKTVKNGVKDIFEVLGILLSSVDLINSLNSAEIDISNLGTNSGSLTNAIDAIGKIIDELPEAFQNGAASELSGEVLTTVKNFNNVFTHIKIMMGSLQEAFKVLSPTANPNAVPMFTFKQRLEDMFNDMSGIVDSYNRARIGNTAVLKTKMENLADAFEDIKRIMTKLQQMQAIKLEAGTKKGGSLFKSMQTINDLMTDLGNAFAPEIVNTLNGNIQTFVTAVDEMFAAIDRLTMGESGTGAIDISIKFNPDISGLAATIGAIRAANRRIASAVRAIKTEYSKTINVKIRANVNTSGAVSAISGGASLVKSAAEGAIEKVNQSRGGYTSRHGVLYRSGGGSVFRPRGTDKIPAMLTEGEYVHRKQAVDTFGIDFMRKVNNLDIRGAMNALLARGGMSASIGRQSIINNTVNNNQRVTQNINTNNPQFARIRASRFAGAL